MCKVVEIRKLFNKFPIAKKMTKPKEYRNSRVLENNIDYEKPVLQLALR